MTQFHSTVAKKSYSFKNVKELLAKASPARSGDALAGIAAENDEERVAAQLALADLPRLRPVVHGKAGPLQKSFGQFPFTLRI